MCSAPKKWVMKGHHVIKKDRTTVEDLIHRDDITMRLPTTRQAKFHFMHTAMAPAYKQYCQEQKAMGSWVLSLSAFYCTLPKHLKYMCDIPYWSCLCDESFNFSLQMLYLLPSYRVCHIEWLVGPADSVLAERHPRWNSNDWWLSPQLHFQGVPSLQVSAFQTKAAGSKPGVWFQAKHSMASVGDRGGLRNQQASWLTKFSIMTLFKLLDVFGPCITTQSKHLFHFHWQGHQFELIRRNLKPGQLLMVKDFAQNLVRLS